MDDDKKEVALHAGANATKGIVHRIVVPKVDIFETPDSIVIMADMPGVGTDSLEITVEKNVLAIKGRVAQAARTGNYTVVYAEREPEEYRRNFTISNDVDREKIDAVIKNGVLHLTLHKAEPARVRKINVKAA